MQTADWIIFYRCPLSSRALDMVNVRLFAGQEVVSMSWTYDPDLTDCCPRSGRKKKQRKSRISNVECIALNEEAVVA